MGGGRSLLPGVTLPHYGCREPCLLPLTPVGGFVASTPILFCLPRLS
jgi:hypothetical protein